MVTVGMNYQVIEGKGEEFESVFKKVLGIMNDMEGHSESHLYNDISDRCTYLIVSEWSDRSAFDAFIASDRFKGVVNWGKEEVLSARPKHEVYESASDKQDPASAPAGCPVH